MELPSTIHCGFFCNEKLPLELRRLGEEIKLPSTIHCGLFCNNFKIHGFGVKISVCCRPLFIVAYFVTQSMLTNFSIDFKLKLPSTIHCGLFCNIWNYSVALTPTGELLPSTIHCGFFCNFQIEDLSSQSVY